MNGDGKCQVNVLKEASSRTKFFVDRHGTCLFAYLSLHHAPVTRIQCPLWELSEGPWEKGSSYVCIYSESISHPLE